MKEIDAKKYGLFMATLRKEHQLTQKELADKLFVSDKTVSKWERGASLPNIALLIPIAKLFDITVDELLAGQRSATDIPDDQHSIKINAHLKKQQKIWKIIYGAAFILAIFEISLLSQVFDQTAITPKDTILIVSLMLLFAGWFIFAAKDHLPIYYDQHDINFVAQGIFKMHLPGMHFNNSNWPYICFAMRIFTLSSAILYPLILMIIILSSGFAYYQLLNKILILILILTMIALLYYIQKNMHKQLSVISYPCNKQGAKL